MDFQYIQTSKPSAHITCIMLNRPQAANALNTQLANELKLALAAVRDATDVRTLIITGAGSRVFCAGADLKERIGMDKAAWDVQHHAFEAAFAMLNAIEIPVIAAVNGAAIAGGLELALACDLIVASPNATFAFKEATLGIMPGLGGTQRLPRAIGERAALKMLLTSEKIDAEKALTLGLINRISRDIDVMPDALMLAEQIVQAAPLSIKAIKKAVREGASLPLQDALALELKLYATLIESDERKKRIAAFNQQT